MKKQTTATKQRCIGVSQETMLLKEAEYASFYMLQFYLYDALENLSLGV